jgi:hypothetical protein
MSELPALQIDSDVSLAWSIPAPFYTDPAVGAQEIERIFARTWQMVGRREQLAKPGDFFTTELLGEPLLLVRGAQGELRGFYTSVVTAPGRRPQDADRASCFAAVITVGPTDSTVRSSARRSLKVRRVLIPNNSP